MLQTMTVSCRGGLDLSSNVQELLNRPGEAIKLTNYECSKEGGYRRVSGFAQYGIDVPGNGIIKGIHVIPNQGVLVAKDTGLYHSFDGTYWVQVNKVATDVDEAAIDLLPADLRTDSTRWNFDTFKFLEDQQIYMTDGKGNPMFLLITGTDRASARYTYRQITLGTDLTGAGISEFFKSHFLLADVPANPSTFYYSSIASTDIFNEDGDIFPQEKFNGSTSGFISVGENITGLKSFRETLYVFCTKSIWKVVGLETGNPQVVPVTRDVGCVDGKTIQEVGGNLLFLAPDGIRTVAGTAKIGDVELGIVSRKVQPKLDKILKEFPLYQFSSMVYRTKNQYRLFYSKINETMESKQEGLIVAYIFDPTTGQADWNYSEVLGQEVSEATSGGYNNIEAVFHGNFSGKLMQGEIGNTYDGAVIKHTFQSPYIDFGDIGIRKNVHKVFLTTKPEGAINIGMDIRYDYMSSDVYQPETYILDQITGPALFGSGVFGVSIFGAQDIPNRDVFTEGSGHTVSIRIVDQGQPDAPFDIQSLVYDVIMNGRI
jgi:hypothetical protein